MEQIIAIHRPARGARALAAAAALVLALVLGALCPATAFASTTAYVNQVRVTLHANASSSSASTYIKYGTEVSLGDYVSSGSSWREVTYDGDTYYVYESNDEMFASLNPVATEASGYSTYASATTYQREVMEEALSWLSANVVYGHGDSSGVAEDGAYTFDCSGFASYVLDTVMQTHDVYLYDLSTNLDVLYATTAAVNYGYDSAAEVEDVIAEGGTLDESLLEPGDIIFFDLLDDGDDIDHCGIYLGDGKFIHVTSTWDCACVMPLSGIYAKGFVAAKRYLPESKPSKINATVWTTSQKTSVYKADSSSSGKKTTLAAEAEVTLIWADGDSSTSGATWGYVKYTTSSGKKAYGYILLKYLSNTDPDATSSVKYASKSIRLYKTYSTSGGYITIAKNTQVTYYGRYSTTSYYKVDYHGTRYYVYKSSKSYLKSTTKISKATLSYTSTTYSGSKKKPSVTVKTASGKKVSSSYYTVTYKNNKGIGTATVTIKGRGKYTGTITKTFTIKPAKVSISSAKSSSAGKATIKWGKVSGSVTYYQVYYRVKGSSTWSKVTVKGSSSTVSKKLTGLKSGKTYQVKVRAYKKVSGTTYYGSWSSVKTVKVK